MARTRINTGDIGDSQVQAADLADGAATFAKLALATDPAIEDAGSGLTRVKVDGVTVHRSANGLYADGQINVAYNATGAEIPAGRLVYMPAAVTGGIPRMIQASASNGFAAAGITLEAAAAGATARILTLGILTAYNTSSWTAGDLLYLSATTGGLTNVAPAAPNRTQLVGMVLTSDATTGTIRFNFNIPSVGQGFSYGAAQLAGTAFNLSLGNSMQIASGDLEAKGFEERSSDPSLEQGRTWYRTDVGTHRVADGIASRSLIGQLHYATAASAEVNTTASESFFDTNQRYTLPANYLAAGRKIRIRAGGKYGMNAGVTIQLRMNLGALNLVDTGGQSALSSASMNRNWSIDVEVYCTAAGSSGTVFGNGFALLPTTIVLPAMLNASTLNTTIGNLIAVSVQFSASAAANRAQMQYLSVEGA